MSPVSANGTAEQAGQAMEERVEPAEMTTQEAPAAADGGNAAPGTEERPRERRWEDRRPGREGGGRERRWENNRREPRDSRGGNRDRDEERGEDRDDGDPRRSLGRPLNIAELDQKTREELTAIGEELGVEDAATLRKQDLVFRLLQVQAETRGNVFSGGFIEISDDGNYGFLRGESMLPGPHDIYVSQSQLRRFALRPGDYITGQVRHPKDNEKYYGLLKVEAVNGMDPEVAKRRPYFENLTAIFPREQMKLETT
ncbi:MAG: Rho termination factor N-terminal domain-containing protein, partial [Dehalococcoidia bacterium]